MAHYREPNGITVDHAYRYTRIGYSVVVWLLSAGGHGRLLSMLLVLVNLLGVAAMAWLGALLARESGRQALWGLLFAAYFGLVVSVGRDTSEPVADACLLGGLLAYRHRRFVLAALLVSYAVFTNEPVLVLPVVLALTRVWQVFQRRVRPGRGPRVGGARLPLRAAAGHPARGGARPGRRGGGRVGQPDLAVLRARGGT
jgi:hypothetical protein